MAESLDFERIWLDKLAHCLGEQAGEGVRSEVLRGSERLTMATDRQEIIDWTKDAMIRLEALTDPATAWSVMTGCACHYPKGQLQEARLAYEETGDIGPAHRLLQADFEAFLRDDLALDEGQVGEIVERGWGLAGVRQGSAIIATKIPKSGYLAGYLAESDPQKRRELYCHCPRVRAAVASGETLPAIYCYCGAGFYQGIWEEILQRPVRVEVLESVLQGGDVCQVAIHLDESAENTA